MAAEPHVPTCICRDCLPGGARPKRTRPYGGVDPEKCDHHEYPDWYKRVHPTLPVTQASRRLRIPLIGGGHVVLCRLCGTVVERSAPA